MKGSKWLPEAVHMENIRIGSLNIVCGPTGSGKTEWALSQLPERISAPYKMVYLIDTKTAKTNYCRTAGRLSTRTNGGKPFSMALCGLEKP